MRILLLLFFQPWLLKKCYWIVWGADLYTYRNPRKSIRSKIREFIRRRVIKNFGHVCTLVKDDYELAREVYNVRGKYLPAVYLSEEWENTISQVLETTTVRSGNNLKIIVGNSATETNHHIEVFKLLEKFSTQNIEIYCPLSYGDATYADEIIIYGTKIFKDKFKPLVKFMDKVDYIEFLGTMDIGIFNNDRQQGLGNIYSLLSLGKKVYLREDTSMWNELHSEKELSVYSINKVGNISFEEFLEFNNENIEKNRVVMYENYSQKANVEIWRNIFEVI